MTPQVLHFPSHPQAITLRDYQQQSVSDLRREMLAGNRSVLLQTPTGGGKTIVASAIMKGAVAKDKRVLFLAHRRELVHQCDDKLNRFGVASGIIMAGVESNWSLVQVASVQTIHARVFRSKRLTLEEPDLIVIDEAHRSTAMTYRRVLEAFPDAWVLGLTATPVRGDGTGLGLIYKSMVLGPSNAELTKQGWLVPIAYYMPTKPDLTGVKVRAGDYVEEQLQTAMDKPKLVGDVVEQWCKHAAGRPTVVFATGVRHSMHLAEEFRREGIAAEHLDGTTPLEEREGILSRLAGGETQVVSNCMVLCLDAETEILTSSGWVGHRQMTKDHEVANWDQGKVWFERPIDVVSRPLEQHESMYSIQSRGVDARVTGGHRMVFRTLRNGTWKKSPVEDLVNRVVQLPTVGLAEPEKKAELTLDQCRFIGFWVGDGSKQKKPKGGVEYTASQSLAYPLIVAWFDKVISSCGFDFRRHERDYSVPHVRWSFARGTGFGPQKRNGVKDIEQYLDKDGSSLLWGLDAEQFDAFLEGLWYADGNHGTAEGGYPGRWTIYATRKPLLDLIQAIGVTRGMHLSVRPASAPRKENHNQLWILTRRSTINHTTARHRFKRENLWHPEDVWCVKTQSLNIITRRNGCVMVMGNTEGWDCPVVSCCVLARPTKSLALFLQMAGRTLRPAKGKTDCLILDHAGSAEQFGDFITPWGKDHVVFDEVPWSLDGKEKLSERAKKKKKPKLAVVCSQCFALFSAKVCPNCGTPVPERLPQAVEFEEGELARVRGSNPSMKDKARVLAELKGYALEKGFKNGWAMHSYRRIFGVWPHSSIKFCRWTTPSEEVRGWAIADWRSRRRSLKPRKAAER